MKLPKHLKYTKDYSWVDVSETIVSLGVIEFAAKKVEEFVFINLPKNGTLLKSGDTYASVEALKWSGHLTIPFSGKIVAVNTDLFDDPAKINADPYGSWIIKVAPDSEVDGVLTAEEAKTYYEGNIK
jgi:glycine cleavage system H protein